MLFNKITKIMLKSQAFTKKSDQLQVKKEFSKFGDCSINFTVTFIQPKETLVKYYSQEQAEHAYSNLNNRKFLDVFLNLQHLSNNKLENPEPAKLKYKLTDIEISIPSKPINFFSTIAADLTPNSYSSPCFPDITQSSIESSKSSARSDLGQNESPVSVSMLPIGNPWKGIRWPPRIRENEPEEQKLEFQVSLPIPPLKRKLEGVSLAITSKKPKEDLFFCEYCKKTVKKKSVKAHNSSKLHQSNLKMN